MADQDMSFLPEDYVARRVEMRTNIICLSLFGVVLLATVGAYVVKLGASSRLREEQRQLAAAFEEEAKRISQLDELQQSKHDLLRKAQVTATLIEPVPRSNLLAELINRMPVALSTLGLEMESRKIVEKPGPGANGQGGTALSAAQKAAQAKKNNGQAEQEPGPPPLEIPRYHVTVSLTGLAPTDIQVAQYMTALARCELLQDVELVFSEESRVDDLSMRKFKIDMILDPDVDVRHMQPLIAERQEDPALLGEEGSVTIDLMKD